MADETEDIADLEAFHQEMLESVGRVRQMVAGWLPSTYDLSTFNSPQNDRVDLESLRSRPERLGLGAKPSSSKTSVIASADSKTAEGRMLKSVLSGGNVNGKKRKAGDAPDSSFKQASASRSNVVGSATAAATNGGNSDTEDEDSRSKVFSVKGKKAAPTDYFHSKAVDVSKQPTSNGSEVTKSSKKAKKQKKKANPDQAANTEHFATPKLPKPRASSGPSGLSGPVTPGPASPNRNLHKIKPPYALPPGLIDPDIAVETTLEDGEEENENGDGSDDDRSTVTASTFASTLLGSPDPGDGQPKKKKRKKKKKKKSGTTAGTAKTETTSEKSMLFGDSVLD